MSHFPAPCLAQLNPNMLRTSAGIWRRGACQILGRRTVAGGRRMRMPCYCHRALSSSTRNSSSRSRGAGIPAHVVTFTILMLPALGYTLWADRYGPSDASVEQEVRERYGGKVRDTKQKNENLQAFFQHAIASHDDDKVESQLDEMLKAGKGGKKRMYAVNELYGTAEGAALREQKLQESRDRVKAQKQKRKQKKKADKTVSPPLQSSREPLISAETVKSAAVVTIVAAVAASIGYLAVAGGGGARK